MKLVVERDGTIGEREFHAGDELRVGRDIERSVAQAACTTGIGKLVRGKKNPGEVKKVTEVEVIKAFEYGGKKHEEGEKVELPESVVKDVIEKGYGKEAEKEVPSFEEPEEPETIEETPTSSESVNVDEYVKSGGWVTPDDVSEGDKLKITGPGRMDDRFEQEYLVIPVKYQGAELELRLGKRNTKRISEKFGPSTGDWIGKKIKVAAIEDYPGLGTKGLILQPVVE